MPPVIRDSGSSFVKPREPKKEKLSRKRGIKRNVAQRNEHLCRESPFTAFLSGLSLLLLRINLISSTVHSSAIYK